MIYHDIVWYCLILSDIIWYFVIYHDNSKLKSMSHYFCPIKHVVPSLLSRENAVGFRPPSSTTEVNLLISFSVSGWGGFLLQPLPGIYLYHQKDPVQQAGHKHWSTRCYGKTGPRWSWACDMKDAAIASSPILSSLYIRRWSLSILEDVRKKE